MRLDCQVLGEKNGMMMVAASDTTVPLGKSDEEKPKDEAFARADDPIYLVEIGGIEKGPFSLNQLKELLSAGRITASASLRFESRTDSIVLSEILR